MFKTNSSLLVVEKSTKNILQKTFNYDTVEKLYYDVTYPCRYCFFSTIFFKSRNCAVQLVFLLS